MLRATLHSLFAHKVRLILTALSIILGVAFVAGTLIFTDTIDRSIDKLFSSVTADVTVSKASELSADAATTVVPEDLVETVAAVDGVTEARGAIFVEGVYLVGDDNKVLGAGGAPTFGTNWDSDRRSYGAIELVAGDPPSGPSDIVIDKASADRHKLGIGDRVSVLTPGPRVDATIVGLFTYGESDGLGATTIAFDTPTAQQLLLEPGEFSAVEATASPGVGNDELTERVQTAVGADYDAKSAQQTSDEIREDVDQIMNIFRTFLLVFAAIALFVGIFIILNTFSILVAQRTRELALFRAVGASRPQVTRSVLTEALVIGFIGATLGLLLGFGLATGLRALMAAFGADFGDDSLVLQPRTVVVSYLVGILVTVIAAYVPARRAAGIPPVAALRDDAIAPAASLHRRLVIGMVLGGAGVAAVAAGLAGAPLILLGLGVALTFIGVIVLMPLIARPVVRTLGQPVTKTHGTVGTLARENAMRNPRRTAVTAASLMVGLALVAAISVIAASLKSSVDRIFDETVAGDYQIMNSIGGRFSSEIGDELAAVPGVQEVTRRVELPGKIGERETFVTGLTPDAVGNALRVDIVEGSPSALADGELLLSVDAADRDDLGVGDSVQVALASGERTMQVGGVYDGDQFLIGGYVMDVDVAKELGGSTQDNLLLLSTGGDTTPEMRAPLDAVLADYPNVTLEDQAEAKQSNRAAIDQLLLIIWALLLLAIIIAVIGIINTLVLSVYERTREIGLLRAVGLGRRQLKGMIRLESMVICVFGAIVGVLVGVGFGVALAQSQRDEGIEVLSIPWVTSPWYQSLVFFVVLAAFIGVLAALWPARRAAKLDVIQAVTTE